VLKSAVSIKAEPTGSLRQIGGSFDFVPATGDDRTDEDLFAQLPPEAFSIHGGQADH